jgi:hypothetical protein
MVSGRARRMAHKLPAATSHPVWCVPTHPRRVDVDRVVKDAGDGPALEVLGLAAQGGHQALQLRQPGPRGVPVAKGRSVSASALGSLPAAANCPSRKLQLALSGLPALAGVGSCRQTAAAYLGSSVT